MSKLATTAIHTAHAQNQKRSRPNLFHLICDGVAPRPDSEVFAVKHKPCPADVGPLPAEIAEATGAAISVLEHANSISKLVHLFSPDRLLTEPKHQNIRYFPVMMWWWLVAELQPARERVLRVAQHLNRHGGPLKICGFSSISAHHAALDVANEHARRPLFEAGMRMIGLKRWDGDKIGNWNVGEMCRDAVRNARVEPVNQLMQDSILANFAEFVKWYDKHQINKTTTHLRTLILTEARNAAEDYERTHGALGQRSMSDIIAEARRNLETAPSLEEQVMALREKILGGRDSKPQGPYAHGCFRWGKRNVTGIPADQWMYLKAHFDDAGRPSGLVPDEELVECLRGGSGSGGLQSDPFKSLRNRTNKSLGGTGAINRPKRAGGSQFIPTAE